MSEADTESLLESVARDGTDAASTDTGFASSTDASTGKKSFAKALVEFRRTTLKAVPTFVLAILALLVASGTAYALYRVATEVVIPAIEQAMGQTTGQEAGEEDDSMGEAPSAYTARSVSEQVAVRNNVDSSEGTHEKEWTYLQFDADVESDALRSLNERLKEEFYEEVDAAEEYAKKPGEQLEAESVTARNGVCDAIRGELAFTHVYTYETNWGPHGWSVVDARVFNLETGEEVAPWDAVGMTEEELEAAALDALDVYISTLDAEFYTPEELREEAEKLAGRPSQYVMTESGLAIHVGPYGFGLSYADGTRDILVVPMQEGADIGSNVEWSMNGQPEVRPEASGESGSMGLPS